MPETFDVRPAKLSLSTEQEIALLLELLTIAGLWRHISSTHEIVEQGGVRMLRVSVGIPRGGGRKRHGMVLMTPLGRIGSIDAALEWFVSRGGLYGLCERLNFQGFAAEEVEGVCGRLSLRFPVGDRHELPMQERDSDPMVVVRIFTMLSHVDPLDGIAAVRRLPSLD